MKELESSLLRTLLLFVFAMMAASHAFTTGAAKESRKAEIDQRTGLSSEPSVQRQYLRGGAFEGFSPRDEIVSKRTMTSKHFRAGNGTGTAVISTGSIHYADGEGVLRDTDTRVMASRTAGFAFENTTNNLRSYFSGEDLNRNGVRVDSQNGAITIAMDPSIAWTDEAGHTEVVESSDLSNPIRDNDKVTYFKLLPSADSEFMVDYDRLKNNLILNRLPDGLIGKSGTLGYSEFIELPAGWSLSSEGQPITAEARINGSLVVVDEQGRAVFTFPAPEVYERSQATDIREARARSTQAYYVVRGEGRRLQLITNVSVAWLSASERSFPVVIDPSVDLGFQDNGNWRYSCTGCSCSTCNPPIPPPASYNPGRSPEPYNSYNHSGESAAGWFTWDVSSVQNQCISNVEISYVRAFCIPGINVVGINYVPLAPSSDPAFGNALIDDSRRVGTLQFPGNDCGNLGVYSSLSGARSVIRNGPSLTLGFATSEVPSSITFIVAANLRITYQPGIVVDPSSVPAGTLGVAYTPVTFTQTNGFGSVIFSTNSTLPSGMTLSGAGVLSGTPTQFGTFPITVNATDQNLCVGSRTVSLFIDRPPVANCKNVTVSAGPTCTANASIDNGSFDPDGGGFTTSQAPPGPYPLGNTTVTLTVTDPLGASSQCSATVTVQDKTPPSITCPANITQAADPGQCTSVVNYTVNASDLCSSVTVVSTPISGFAFPKGTTTVTATATDASGNAATCSFTVTVNDTQAPSITCPSNISVPQDTGKCTAVVTYQLPTVSDNCSGVGTPVCSPQSGLTFPLGTTTVSCTVSDASSNSSSCSFTVTVNDTVSPVVSCPANIVTSTAPNLCSAMVSFTPSATDNCSSTTVVYSPASGSVFPKGTTTVTVTATDAAGNKSTCAFTVTVNDTQPPVIVCPANITVPNDPDHCSAVVGYASPMVGDNCPGVGAPVCSPPSGSTFPKGTTTVTCSVSDLAGNMSACTFTVTINDTQPPVITCPPDTIVAAINPGDTTVIGNYPPPSTSDNCAVASVACSPPSGSAFPIGVTVVTCTVTDTSSNVTSCTFTMSAYDVCLEDDSISSRRLLFNSFTGDYLFTCGGTRVMGTGTIIKKGGDIMLTHNLTNRRVSGRVSSATRSGSATLEYPLGTKCSVLDRDITNNNCGSSTP